MTALAEAPAARTQLPRRVVLLAALGAGVLVIVIVALGIGAMPIPLPHIIRALVGADDVPREAAVILSLRLPRVILGLLVGSALGLSGAVLQGLFRNPLADPGLIGVSSGAALGAVAAIMFGDAVAAAIPFAAGRYLLPLAAFAGGVGASLLVRRLAGPADRAPVGAMLLAGLAISNLLVSATGLLIYSSDDRQLRDIVFWTMGSLATGGWGGVLIAGPFVLLAASILLRLSRPLDAMLLGEREAAHLGIDTGRVRRLAILAAALAVGSTVAVAGMIGFVGLIVPHLLRLVAGPGHRFVLPGSALLGAALLVAADGVARVAVAPAELPVGLITGAIGGPFFIWLLVQRRRAVS